MKPSNILRISRVCRITGSASLDPALETGQSEGWILVTGPLDGVALQRVTRSAAWRRAVPRQRGPSKCSRNTSSTEQAESGGFSVQQSLIFYPTTSVNYRRRGGVKLKGLYCTQASEGRGLVATQMDNVNPRADRYTDRQPACIQ